MKTCYIQPVGVCEVRRLLRVEQRQQQQRQQQQPGGRGGSPNRFLPTANRDVCRATTIDSRLPGQCPKASRGANQGQTVMGR